MRLLLDTHAFLWFINGDENLSEGSRLLIQQAPLIY
jgi:PIN domain nuclease of toxin-antitoxin system